MHCRNRYLKAPADFGELAECRPSLKPYLIEKRGHRQPSDPAHSTSERSFAYTLDFSDPAAVRELTCAVLERDFGLKLEIPLDRLIPTVPQKLNYIHWLEDLLSLSHAGGVANKEEGVACEVAFPKGRKVVGIDIGTGTSCIYPLLASTLNHWSFLATDVAMDAVRCASGNVARNNLEENIKVKLVSKDCMLKEVVEPSVPQYAFSMCNPPFFESEADRLGEVGSRGSQRPLACTFSSGTAGETVTEGGEVGFVRRMIADSLELQDKVLWYTSMLGKRSSLKVLLSELTRSQVPVVTTTEFIQGKTWRWGVAWSFDTTLKDKVERMKKRSRKRSSPLQLLVKGNSPSLEGVLKVKQSLEEMLQELEITSTAELSCDESCDSSDAVILKCVADRVTWTHQRRKRRLLDRLKSQEPGARINEADSESSLDELQRKIKEEISSLSVPCHIEFTARVMLQPASGAGSPSKKRRGEGASGEKKGEAMAVCLELNWTQGDKDRDLLHQLLQYLRNNMHSKSFQ